MNDMNFDITEALPLVLHPKDVSDALGVSIDYARYLFRSGTLPVSVIGKRKVVTRTNFIKWMDGLERYERR